MSTTTGACSGASGSQLQREVERDHNIQCEDLSDVVSVEEFKKKCGELYEDVCAGHVMRGAASEDHVTEGTLIDLVQQEIAEACNTASLLPPGGLDPVLKGKKPSATENTQLQCLNHRDTQRGYFERKGLLYSMSMLPFQQTASPESESSEAIETIASASISQPEVVLSLLVFHPIKKRRDTELLLLGSQLLTELRDKIPCFRDYIDDQDYSEDPNQFKHHTMLKGNSPNPSKSAFFFINNTFYNDRRYPDSQDLSAPILQWTYIDKRIAMSPRLDHFLTADMGTTRLDQLQLRLGYPYLFCHHSTCQHLVIFTDLRYELSIFTDLRLLHPTDSQKFSDYPKILSKHVGKRRKCFVCNIFSPLWVTIGDEMAPESPCLFCDDCFTKLHYSVDGKKMCSFNVYPYNPTMLV